MLEQREMREAEHVRVVKFLKLSEIFFITRGSCTVPCVVIFWSVEAFYFMAVTVPVPVPVGTAV
jgi:hypothetical protein